MRKTTMTDASGPSCQLDPEQVWYVPNRKLRTKSASNKAIEIAEWIDCERMSDEEPDELSLFFALHTCAYRAKRRVRRVKSISPAERTEWTRRWLIIREYIVERNLGLVYSIFKRFVARYLDEDDLLSEAMYALTRAVDRFDPNKGYRFSTYACNVIWRSLNRLGKRTGRYRLLFPVQNDVSLEQPDKLPDSQTELYVERLNHILDQNLGHLTDLESKILKERFLINGRSGLTLRQIGDVLGLSKERVRQIQKNALGKLREVLELDTVLE